MNRNINTRFSKAPLDIDIQRSRFHRPSSHKTTMNAGNLYPIYLDEVLPGDTFNMNMATLARMSTPVFPVMDDCYLDTFFFFVPNRLVWDHWKQLMGENNVSSWVDTENVYEVPQILSPGGVGWKHGGVCDHFGLPPGYGGMSTSCLPLRAYRLIWNEWFRDQNLQDPLLVNLGDTETDYSYDDLLKVAKIHDYFTSALPAPQKAPNVLIPIDVSGNMPVYSVYATNKPNNDGVSATGLRLSQHYNNSQFMSYETIGLKDGYVYGDVSGEPGSTNMLHAANLRAYAGVNSSSLAVQGTINELRTAFQIQKLYERDARSGTRYTEMIRAHFSVQAADASLQRPQYLGGERIAININQVVQTSATDETSPQGNTAAVSKTVSRSHVFDNSFTEHGMIIGLACIRTIHTYQQGINRYWSKRSRLDFYTPELANIGEMPILNKEIYVGYYDPAQTAWDNANEEVFGYQEAWADYRYKPSIVTGAFRHDTNQGSLDAWTYADYFADRPTLSEGFIEETTANVDRTLAVQSDLADQFLLDMYFDLNVDRPMPVYSVPGLADHH